MIKKKGELRLLHPLDIGLFNMNRVVRGSRGLLEWQNFRFVEELHMVAAVSLNAYVVRFHARGRFFTLVLVQGKRNSGVSLERLALPYGG